MDLQPENQQGVASEEVASEEKPSGVVEVLVPDEVVGEVTTTDVAKEQADEDTSTTVVTFSFLRSSSPAFHPRLVTSASSCFRPHYDDPSGVPYTRGCKFSPDGLCVLSCSSDDAVRIFETPPQAPAEESTPTSWEPCIVMKEGETVYDFSWYPKMDSACPDTCCLVDDGVVSSVFQNLLYISFH